LSPLTDHYPGLNASQSTCAGWHGLIPFKGANMKQNALRILSFLCIAVFVISASPRQADASTAAIPLGHSGTTYSFVTSYGTVEEPYTVDLAHLNRPEGLYLDESETLFVSEERGARIVRSDPSFNPIGSTGSVYTADNAFVHPTDMAKDNAGSLWVADWSRVVQYDASGADAAFLQSFPPTNSWVTGDDNSHFYDVKGLAFDHLVNQHLFVSDSGNERVQVFGFDAEGKPVYLNTIGETHIQGDDQDNEHFNHPVRLAVDSANRLLVADSYNNRVQRCSSADGWANWTCETFAMGGGLSLNYPLGVSVDAGGNVLIADSNNSRILRCADAGSCAVQVENFPGWASDVEGKANGDVLISDWNNMVVRRFNAAGQEQPIFMGTLNVPYTTTLGHFFTPRGITVGADGSVFILEQYGYRLVKLNPAGEQQWVVGAPGLFTDADTGFGDYWAGLEGNPAVDAAGRIYVPDTSNDRVQILNPDGSFYNRIGMTRNGGSDNTRLSCPTTTAINPVNGDILVADKCNQRIQVFSADTLAYKATLGETGVSGSDNAHFNSAWGLAVDSKGTVYVADTENFRVQKCTYTTGTNFSCTTFTGETGVYGNEYNHLHPLAVAVDGAGHVFAADDWNSRVQVFNASGGYLTTLGGGWGNYPTDLRSVSSVAVDKWNKVYISDNVNHRVLVYAPGGSGSWLQLNHNGFGDVNNYSVWSLGWFNNTLYAGTNNGANGAEIWRKLDSGQWEQVVSGGLGNSHNQAIDHLLAFNGKLYASTYNALNNGQSDGAEIWRSDTGNPNTWAQVVTGGSGGAAPDPANGEFFRMFIFNSQICSTTWAAGSLAEGVPQHGAEIWCSPTGSEGTWTRLAGNGLVDNANILGIMAVQSHNGRLFAGVYNINDGTEIYSSSNGAAWTPFFNEFGWGDSSNYVASALEEFNGYLYFLLNNRDHYGVTIGRCQVCDGTDREEITGSFNTPATLGMSALEVHDGSLYMVTSNSRTGLRVWKSDDGNNWSVVAPVGLGNPGKAYTYWDNAFLSAGGNLYLGTWNRFGSAEVWQLGQSLFLPAIRR
jgi:hypothetical protein